VTGGVSGWRRQKQKGRPYRRGCGSIQPISPANFRDGAPASALRRQASLTVFGSRNRQSALPSPPFTCGNLDAISRCLAGEMNIRMRRAYHYIVKIGNSTGIMRRAQKKCNLANSTCAPCSVLSCVSFKNYGGEMRGNTDSRDIQLLLYR
jgi:hypothetical protein